MLIIFMLADRIRKNVKEKNRMYIIYYRVWTREKRTTIVLAIQHNSAKKKIKHSLLPNTFLHLFICHELVGAFQNLCQSGTNLNGLDGNQNLSTAPEPSTYITRLSAYTRFYTQDLSVSISRFVNVRKVFIITEISPGRNYSQYKSFSMWNFCFFKNQQQCHFQCRPNM